MSDGGVKPRRSRKDHGYRGSAGPAELSEPSAGRGEALIAVTAALNRVELRVAAGGCPV